MGSRIMHLIIGQQIAEKLNVEDRTSFLLGSIAPDAVQTKDEFSENSVNMGIMNIQKLM